MKLMWQLAKCVLIHAFIDIKILMNLKREPNEPTTDAAIDIMLYLHVPIPIQLFYQCLKFSFLYRVFDYNIPVFLFLLLFDWCFQLDLGGRLTLFSTLLNGRFFLLWLSFWLGRGALTLNFLLAELHKSALLHGEFWLWSLNIFLFDRHLTDLLRLVSFKDAWILLIHYAFAPSLVSIYLNCQFWLVFRLPSWLSGYFIFQLTIHWFGPQSFWWEESVHSLQIFNERITFQVRTSCHRVRLVVLWPLQWR